MKNIFACIISCALLATIELSAQNIPVADAVAQDANGHLAQEDVSQPDVQDTVPFPAEADMPLPENQDTASVADTPPADTLSSQMKQPAEKKEIYKGTTLKIDLFNPLYAWFGTEGEILAYEALIHVNLLHKYFPTIEAGYAHTSHTSNDEASFNGGGFFSRVGADFNLMKKNQDAGNYFLGGLRFGMAQQKFSVTNISITDGYWNTTQIVSFPNSAKFDCWAEIVGGAHVKIYKGLNMGWTVRFKFLITRTEEDLHAWYIPGFGYNANTTFGFDYYIGYTF